jgi:hypothetical protein
LNIHRWKGWRLAGIIGLLAACGQVAPAAQPAIRMPAANADVTVNVREHMAERWLAGQPCPPPCWEGMTPGHSTAPEALQLLENNPNITILEADEDSIRWNWNDHRSSDAGIITVANGRVERIRLDFAPRLGEVIAAYGEPSGVLAYTGTRREYPGTDVIELVDKVRIMYAEQGFYFDALPADNPRIDAELMLIGPVLIAPDSDPGDLSPRLAATMMPWQGEQSFDFYYSDASPWHR